MSEVSNSTSRFPSSGSSSGAATPSGRERSAEREATSNQSSDSEMSEYMNLRCSSLRTEMVAEREKRRRKSSGYPGLAFGSSGIFSSNTQMKFNIISNELHNIQNVQLKRVRDLSLDQPIMSCGILETPFRGQSTWCCATQMSHVSGSFA